MTYVPERRIQYPHGQNNGYIWIIGLHMSYYSKKNDNDTELEESVL